MNCDHKHAIDSMERNLNAVLIELEGLKHSTGVSVRMIESAKDALQDVIGCAKLAVISSRV